VIRSTRHVSIISDFAPVPWIGLVFLIGLIAVRPAFAQVQLQGLAGMTDAAARAPFYAGAIGIKVSFLELDVEGGRFTNVLPSGVLDALHQLEQQHNLPVQAIASVPAWYGLAQLRLIAPGGPLKPFVGGGLGVAHLEPQIDVSVNGINLGDIFGLTSFQPQNKTMAVISAGLRLDFGVINVEGGYRYIAIFSQFTPSTNTNNDKILTNVNAVYGALAIRF
jgi:hypothetical protein